MAASAISYILRLLPLPRPSGDHMDHPATSFASFYYTAEASVGKEPIPMDGQILGPIFAQATKYAKKANPVLYPTLPLGIMKQRNDGRMDVMRLFIALDIPDSAKEMLGTLQQRLMALGVGGPERSHQHHAHHPSVF